MSEQGPLLARAAAFTVREFDGVVRKGNGVPYVTHLFSVCALVGEYGGDEEQMAAALLHDWLEDIEGSSLEDLHAWFGPRVAHIVLACSDTLTRPKPAWQQRKERHLAHIRTQAPEIKLVAAADKLHNGMCLLTDVRQRGDEAFACFNAPKDKVLWYYRAAAEALGHEWQHPILERLTSLVTDLEVAAK